MNQDEQYKQIIQTIFAACTAKGWSRERLARETFLSRNSIYNIEHFRCGASVNTLLLMCNALGLVLKVKVKVK
jgi:transcriptional regulator with XRE-family HTH domain